MRKLAALGLLSALAALATITGLSTGPAFAQSAKQPVIGTFPITETNVDPGVSATCGFTVTETDTGRGRYEVLFDSTGTPIRAQVEENYTGVFTANGLAVDVAGAGLGIFDLNGGETNTGIDIRVSLPGGGILYIDRGRLVFDANGNLVSEAGPHPSLSGDIGGLCAALTP
jgi:hypothetical protein